MEGVGLAVGIAGLAGLFNTCLDAIEKIDDYKDFGHESRFLVTQFEADKLRLRQWGQIVGVINDTVLPCHHWALDDEDNVFMVRQILSMIKDVCESEDSTDTIRLSKLPADSAGSKRRKIKWALGGKAKRTTQIEHLRVLVQHLHNLTPAESASQSASNIRNVQNSSPTMEHDPQSRRSMELCVLELKDSLRNIRLDIEQRFEVETRRDVFAWLGRTIPNGLYEECLRKKLDGTCDWVLASSQFSSWKSNTSNDTDVNLLWIHGPAGFGKTILCSNLVQHLDVDPDQIVAHFFLSSRYNSSDGPYSAMKSWIAQLMCSCPAAYAAVQRRWGDQDNEFATRADIISTMQDATRAVPNPILVLDGLDECTWPSAELAFPGQETMTGFIDDLRRALSKTSARLLVVSRDELRIRSPFQTGFHLYEVKIMPSDVEQDIQLFSADMVNRRLTKKDEKTRYDIIQRLSVRCNGQFLWLRMQETGLQNWKNKQQLKEAIEETPPGLESIYGRNLKYILQLPPRKRHRAISILRWATFATHPLTIGQMSEAVLIDRNASDFAVHQLPDVVDEDYVKSEFLYACASLIEVRPSEHPTRPSSWTLHLSHFSVKEFLLSQSTLKEHPFKAEPGSQLSIEEQQGVILAKLCLYYLSYARVWEGDFSTESESGKVVYQCSQRPLIAYAANYWYLHVPDHDLKDEELLRCMTSLFDARNPRWDVWRNFHVTEGLDNVTFKDVPDMEPGGPPADPLYYASKLGLVMLVQFLLQHPEHSFVQGGFKTAKSLAIACDRNRTAIVQILCNAGANVEETIDSWTPLDLASFRGHADIVDILLNRGANAETTSNEGWTPISIASTRGHLEVVRLLLTKVSQAHVNSKGLLGMTAFEAACLASHTAVVECLLHNGANPNTRSSDGKTAFHAAAENGDLALFQKLQRYAEEWDIATNDGSKPLNIAAMNGHVELVKYLLDCGADAKSVDHEGWSALHDAAHYGDIAVVESMIQFGADVNVSDTDGSTPIHVAARSGHSEVVAFLGRVGADVDRPDYGAWTPLHFASYKGNVEVVRILLREGSRASMQTSDESTPLHLASENGHEDIVVELLSNGSVISLLVQNKAGFTPLAEACHQGHLKIVRLLIKAQQSIGMHTSPMLYAKSSSSNPISKEGDAEKQEQSGLMLNESASTMNVLEVATAKGFTPLHLAVHGGFHDVVHFLISAGANTSTTDDRNWTPLLSAARRGYLDVVKVLIDTGLDVNAANSEGLTAYLAAACNDNVGVLDYLRDQGAQTSVRSHLGNTPLHIAVASGNSLKTLSCLINYHPQLINTTNQNGATPLHLAVSKGKEEVVTLLITGGAQISPGCFNNKTPLMIAAASGQLSVLKVLQQNIPEGGDKETELGVALSMAACWGQMSIMVYLVESGVSVMSRHLYGKTPLFHASLSGRADAVRYFLSLEANTAELTDSGGRTASLFTSLGGHLNTVKVPIKSGAAADVVGKPGVSPLMLSATRGQEELVSFFLAVSADPIKQGILQRTALQEACINGYANMVRLLLHINIALMDVPDEEGLLPIAKAAYMGQKDVVEVLREFGAEYTGAGTREWMPLGEAARGGHLVVMEHILGTGVSVNSADSLGRTPMHIASQSGSLDAVKFLVDTAGADISLADTNGFTPLEAAALDGHVDIVKFLIEKGAQISRTDNRGRGLLHFASCGGHVNVVKFLLSAGADPNFAAHEGGTPLFLAAFNGHELTVQTLLEGGANAATVDDEGLSPLHDAAEQGHLGIVQKLVDICPGVLDQASKNGSTPLLKATIADHVEVVKFLHEEGASISIPNNEGFTPLNAGVSQGATSVVRYLLQNGADVSVPITGGATPLYCASFGGSLDIVRLLIEARADVSIRKSHGWTPLCAAASKGFVDIVRLLIEAGADISIPNSYGRTPLCVAASNGSVDTVRLLIEAGADVMTSTDDGETPLIEAYKEGNKEVVGLLLERSNITTDELGKLMKLKEAEEYAASRASPYSISAGITRATLRWFRSWRS